ncbi:MAG: hypothetical protein HY701_07025, partial [Gemmatimonadetes bacterium]|nr:hypothetical protein [Gemmatimonadota bacterium]
SWQYVQAIALGGPSIHPAFHASHFWVWADDDTPAIRADVASVGAERWLGGGWLASATAFVRRATGVTVPPPDSGKLEIARRPRFVTGENLAGGFEAGLRRIGASWSASLGYSWGASALEAGGWRYPSPADRRHLVDAMVGVRVLSALRLTAAFTSMSGAPFTRAVVLSQADCTYFAFGCGNPIGSYVQQPNAQRTPAYQSLDVSVQWARTFGRVELSTYLQVKNVLGHDNGSTYSGTVRSERALPTGAKIVWDDRFEPGLPRMPLFGVRMTF